MQNKTGNAIDVSEGTSSSSKSRAGIWRELEYPSLWQLLRDTSGDGSDGATTTVAHDKSGSTFRALLAEARKASPHSTVLLFGDEGGLVASDLAHALPEDATIVSVLADEDELRAHTRHNRRDRVVTAIAPLDMATADALGSSLFWSQYVVVTNASSLLRGALAKDVESTLAKLALLCERLVLRLSGEGRMLKSWQNNPRELLKAIIARGGSSLASAHVVDLDEDAELFMLVTTKVVRTITPLGSDGPRLRLEYSEVQKNRLPMRFPVLIRRENGKKPGPIVPMDLFGVSLHVMGLLHITHFARRQLFERFSMPIPPRFLSLQSLPASASRPLSSFAKSLLPSNATATATTTTLFETPEATVHDVWVCGSRLVFDPSLSNALRPAPRERHLLVPQDVGQSSRKLLAFDEVRSFVFWLFFCSSFFQKQGGCRKETRGSGQVKADWHAAEEDGETSRGRGKQEHCQGGGGERKSLCESCIQQL